MPEATIQFFCSLEEYPPFSEVSQIQGGVFSFYSALSIIDLIYQEEVGGW